MFTIEAAAAAAAAAVVVSNGAIYVRNATALCSKGQM